MLAAKQGALQTLPDLHPPKSALMQVHLPHRAHEVRAQRSAGRPGESRRAAQLALQGPGERRAGMLHTHTMHAYMQATPVPESAAPLTSGPSL